jgi:hypothetical protein
MHSKQHSPSSLGLRLCAAAGSQTFLLLSALAAGKLAVLLSVLAVYKSSDFLRFMSSQWDSRIFESIASVGYTHTYYYAFSPFYPALVSSLIPFVGRAWISGLIVTNVLSFSFPLLVSRAFGFRTALLAELFPTYLVFTTVPYSESLTLLLLAAGILLVMRGRYLTSSAAVSCAVFSSFSAAWTLPSFAIAVLKERRLARLLLFYALPAATGLLILAWFMIRTGGYFTFFSVERSVWGVMPSTPLGQAEWLLNGWFTSQSWSVLSIPLTPTYWLVRNILFESFYLFGAFMLLRADVGERLFLFAYTISASLPLLFLVGTPAVSIPRLLLPAFPVFYSYSSLIGRRYLPAYIATCFVSAMAVAVLQTFSFFS